MILTPRERLPGFQFLKEIEEETAEEKRFFTLQEETIFKPTISRMFAIISEDQKARNIVALALNKEMENAIIVDKKDVRRFIALLLLGKENAKKVIRTRLATLKVEGKKWESKESRILRRAYYRKLDFLYEKANLFELSDLFAEMVEIPPGEMNHFFYDVSATSSLECWVKGNSKKNPFAIFAKATKGKRKEAVFLFAKFFHENKKDFELYKEFFSYFDEELLDVDYLKRFLQEIDVEITKRKKSYCGIDVVFGRIKEGKAVIYLLGDISLSINGKKIKGNQAYIGAYAKKTRKRIIGIEIPFERMKHEEKNVKEVVVKAREGKVQGFLRIALEK